MAERPTFLFIGENIASTGGMSARALADVNRLPLSRYDQDFLRGSRIPAYQWLTRHTALGGVDLRPYIFNHAGASLTPTAITAVGGNRSRITIASHGRPARSTVIVTGVVVSSGSDPNGIHWADRIDANTIEIVGDFSGSYAFASTAITASAGRTLRIQTPDTIGGDGVHQIVASSGSFLTDGFRPGQRLGVLGANVGAGNARLDYLIETVTATKIALRDLGSAGFFQEVAAQSSGFTVQGYARIDAQLPDIYMNPLPGFDAKPNGQTEWIFGQGMYPSNWHGSEAGFLPACLDDPNQPTGFSTAPFIVQARGTTEKLGADMGDGTVRGVVSLTQVSGATRLNLLSAHGWAGTVWVHVQMGPGLEELDGYQQATVIDSDTVQIARTVTGALPNFSIEPYRGQQIGTVAERHLIPSSVSAIGGETEITTTTDHGLAVGDWIAIGNLDATPNIDGAHKVTTVVDSDTFRIGIAVSSASSVDEAWITSRRRWAPAYQQTVVEPRNGGSMLSYAKMILESAWRQIASSGDTTHLAGIFCCWGYTADGDTNGNVAGTGAQIDRFWIDYAAIVTEMRRFAADLEATLSFPLAHASAADIPVVAVAYGPDQQPQDDSGDPGYLFRGKLHDRRLANIWSIRQQTFRALAAIGGKVGMIDPWLEGWPLREGGLFWTPETSLNVGKAMWATWKRVAFNDPEPVTQDRKGVAVYVLTGQSQTVGTVAGSWLLLDNDPLYNSEWINPATGGVLPGKERGVYIWSHLAKQFEEMAPTVGGLYGNVNTHPQVNAGDIALFGPEISLALKLRERHPDGVYIIKLAANGASLQPTESATWNWDPDTGNLYSLLLEAFDEARAWLCERGLAPDVRGFFFDQGEGDANAGLGSSYQAALTAFIARVRQDFSTRVDAGSSKLPFVIGRLMDHDRQTLTAAQVLAVRNAQDAVAAADADVVSIDLDSCAIKTDDIHRSGRGTIRSGLLMGEGIEGCASYGYAQLVDYDLKPFDDESIGGGFEVIV